LGQLEEEGGERRWDGPKPFEWGRDVGAAGDQHQGGRLVRMHKEREGVEGNEENGTRLRSGTHNNDGSDLSEGEEERRGRIEAGEGEEEGHLGYRSSTVGSQISTEDSVAGVGGLVCGLVLCEYIHVCKGSMIM